jgi:hypothetical protein
MRRAREAAIDLARIVTGQREIEIRFIQLLQFEGEQRFIPIGPSHRPVHHQGKAFTCASVHSSHRITGIAVVSPPGQGPNFRAAFRPSDH